MALLQLARAYTHAHSDPINIYDQSFNIWHHSPQKLSYFCQILPTLVGFPGYDSCAELKRSSVAIRIKILMINY